MKNSYFTALTFTAFIKLSVFAVLVGLASLGRAEILVTEGNAPQALSIDIKDSDLTVTRGDKFKVSYDRQLKGTHLSPKEFERTLDKIQVHFDEKTQQISVNMPKLWVGKASAEVHVVVPNSIHLTVQGEDGDIRFSKVDLVDSSVNLADGNIRIDGGKITGKLSIKTEDGDVAIHGLSSSTTIHPIIKGDGKFRNLSGKKADKAASGIVDIITNDGNIEIF